MPKRTDRTNRVKREDVAKLAGVSPATVSYVLNHTKKLSPEVENRVREAVKQLNYKPDRIAQTLAGNRTNTIAFLTSDITNTYQLDVIKGLQAEALKYNYIIYIFDIFGDVGNYIEHLISRRVDGVFISATTDILSDELLCVLRDANIKVLSDMSRNTFLEGVSYVVADRVSGIDGAVEYLKGLGHRKIGFLSGFDENWVYDDRVSAFKQAMKKYFGDDDPVVVYGNRATTTKVGKALMREMIAKHPEVTAVLTTNDMMAIGAIEAAHDAGLSVPQDVSVIGFDNLDRSATCEPPLTTIDQNGKRFGKKLFGILKDEIENGAVGNYILPVKLIVRESTGQARTRHV
ncbi:MAG: LacI family DNA-binding transcriptional regulator [Candidatus Borkfalkiaceae bacterium]|nr:LacI family DNA-binding transcriptional regulator [Christensenellaceae bacterium]